MGLGHSQLVNRNKNTASGKINKQVSTLEMAVRNIAKFDFQAFVLDLTYQMFVERVDY
jgi:hypothetical protein